VITIEMELYSKIQTIIIILILLLICLNSCKEDEDVIDITLITQGIWQLERAEIRYSNSQVTYYNLDTIIYPAGCAADDYTMFLANGMYKDYTSASKCYPNEPDSTEGIWYYNENKHKINLINEASGKSIYKIRILTKSDLVLYMDTTVIKTRDKSYSVRKRVQFRYKNRIP
jgi:hypothetical protein